MIHIKYIVVFFIIIFACNNKSDTIIIDSNKLQLPKNKKHNNYIANPNNNDKSNRIGLSKINTKLLDTNINVLDRADNIEQQLIENGLIDITTIDKSIYIDLRYSTQNNFVGIDMYGDFNKAYLQPEVAEKLSKANYLLKSINPNYSIVVFDAARPQFVQQIMWDNTKLSINDKTKFLSNPKNHSIHNYGAAVDVSIIDNQNIELDMGNEYDSFDKLSYPKLEEYYLEKGILSQNQLDNRLLLRKVMTEAGFKQLPTEWWHFNSCSRELAKSKYKLIN